MKQTLSERRVPSTSHMAATTPARPGTQRRIPASPAERDDTEKCGDPHLMNHTVRASSGQPQSAAGGVEGKAASQSCGRRTLSCPRCLPGVLTPCPAPLHVCTVLPGPPPSWPSSRAGEASAAARLHAEGSWQDLGGPASSLSPSRGLSPLTPDGSAAACSPVSFMVSLPGLFTSSSTEGNEGNEG